MTTNISIKVSLETHAALIARMSARETFNDVITRLLAATAKRRRWRRPKEETK